MKIENESKFLVLHSDAGAGTPRLEIVASFPEVLSRWTAGTRLSPVWLVSGYGLDLSVDCAEPQEILFLGPLQPALILDQVLALRQPGAAEIWLSAGCFNVIVREPLRDGEAACVRDLATWAERADIVYERWIITEGRVSEVHSRAHDVSRTPAELKKLSQLAEATLDEGLQATMEEYLALQASTLTRSAAITPDLYKDFVAVGDSVGRLVQAYADKALSPIDLNSRLVSINAALSRASSQAYSGTPPILGTECHFWTHSLLGTGAANIALAGLAHWVQGVLGEERIPERLRALREVLRDVPNLNRLQTDSDLLDLDLLHAGQIAEDERGPTYPLVTYFSGRDGFSSHLQTLSAPIATLAECNSYRSSLMTVTHEISHILVHGALPAIYPDHTRSDVLEELAAMTGRNYAPANMLAAARKLMFEGLISMEQAERGEDFEIDNILAAIPDIFIHNRLEAQEILVHTFDFVYFYAGNPDFYIKSIWHSWCAIPGIADRIASYVMRTLCAISANLLRDPAEKRLPAAIRAVRTSLQTLQADGGLMSDYVDRALAYLDHIEADPKRLETLRREYMGRLDLVRLVRLFLYSDTLAAKLYSDPYSRSVRDSKTGSLKTLLVYDTAPVGNPITFLRDNLKANPRPAESIWVLHSLAFDLRTPPVGSSHAGT